MTNLLDGMFDMDDVKKQIQNLNDIVEKQHQEIKQLIANINSVK